MEVSGISRRVLDAVMPLNSHRQEVRKAPRTGPVARVTSRTGPIFNHARPSVGRSISSELVLLDDRALVARIT